MQQTVSLVDWDQVSSKSPDRAFDEKSARASIERLLLALKEHGLPWLHSASTLTQLSGLLAPSQDYEKGCLLAADGDYSSALPWFEAYEQRLMGMPSDAEVQAALAETREQIQRCRMS